MDEKFRKLLLKKIVMYSIEIEKALNDKDGPFIDESDKNDAAITFVLARLAKIEVAIDLAQSAESEKENG